MAKANGKSWFSAKARGDSADINIYSDIGGFGVTAQKERGED